VKNVVKFPPLSIIREKTIVLGIVQKNRKKMKIALDLYMQELVYYSVKKRSF